MTLQTGYIWDYIHIKWENVTISHAGSAVKVRQHMCIPQIDRIRLRRIFLNVQEYIIMVQQGDTWMTISEQQETLLGSE